MSVLINIDLIKESLHPFHSGCYQIIFLLNRPILLKVGALCTLHLEEGYFIYTGRHRKALAARINRHLQKHKRIYWHVDYFTSHRAFQVKHLVIYPGVDAECQLNQAFREFLGARVVYPGLGSGDCQKHCAAHMHYCEMIPEKSIIQWLSLQSELKPIYFSSET